MQFKQWITYFSVGLLTATLAISSQAAIWSSSEVHYSQGDILNQANGKELSTSIITFQHASGHKYGDNFFFVDHSQDDDKSTFYGEWYSTFSLGAITGNDMSFGAVKDVGLIAGFNFAPSVDSTWLLPGVRLALDLPGFAMANLDITAYNHSKGGSASADEFVILDEESAYMIDFNWVYPFKAGGLSWSVKGHMEYIDGRKQTNKFGTKELESHILAQPQLHLDLGEALGNEAGNFFVGIEYQYWQNKLGAKDQNESTVQLQTVWNF